MGKKIKKPNKKPTKCEDFAFHLNNHCYGENDCPDCDRNYGYNQACDDWQAYHDSVVKAIYKQFGINLDEQNNYTTFDGVSIKIGEKNEERD